MNRARDWLFVSGSHGPDLASIAAAVMAVYGVARKELHGPWRDRRITDARLAFYWIARHHGGASWPRIAGYLGRDHTTALKGCSRAQASIGVHGRMIDAVMARLGVCKEAPFDG